MAFVCSRGKEPGEQRAPSGWSHASGAHPMGRPQERRGWGGRCRVPPPPAGLVPTRGVAVPIPPKSGPAMLCNNGGAAFSTAGEESSGRGGPGEEGHGDSLCLCGLPSTLRTCGVKDTLGVACLGCRRDGGSRGIHSLLPLPRKCDWGRAGGVGVARAAGVPCTPKCGRPRKGSPCLAGTTGCCFPPFHTGCLHGVGFSSKEGSGLAGVPERESPHVSLLMLPAYLASLEKRQAPTFPCRVMCFVVSVRP